MSPPTLICAEEGSRSGGTCSPPASICLFSHVNGSFGPWSRRPSALPRGLGPQRSRRAPLFACVHAESDESTRLLWLKRAGPSRACRLLGHVWRSSRALCAGTSGQDCSESRVEGVCDVTLSHRLRGDRKGQQAILRYWHQFLQNKKLKQKNKKVN